MFVSVAAECSNGLEQGFVKPCYKPGILYVILHNLISPDRTKKRTNLLYKSLKLLHSQRQIQTKDF